MTGIICLDKPQNITSFSAVSAVRRITGEKKAGHTGTLDPMATGVLPILLGGATRFAELLPVTKKEYTAVFKLGITTDTLDITGKVQRTCLPDVTFDDVLREAQNFKGEISQLPPMYSAIQKDGVRLYELARRGIEVERESRKITVYKLDIEELCPEKYEYRMDVECSGGTYVRSLISDLGEALGCGAVMTELRRTGSNGFEIKNAVTLEKLRGLAECGNIDDVVISVDTALAAYDKVVVTQAQATRFSNGGGLFLDRVKGCKAAGLYRVYSTENVFLGVGEVSDGADELSVKRVFVPR